MLNSTRDLSPQTPRRTKRAPYAIAGVLAVSLAFTACNSGGGDATPPTTPGDPCDNAAGLCAMIDTGMVLFEQCSGCHGPEGRGSAGGNPPLANSDFFMNNKSLTVRILLEGYSERILVNGAYYENSMPSHEFFSNYEIASVLNYLRVERNDSTVISCDDTQFDNEGFPICVKEARTVEARYSDTVSVAYVEFVRDSLGILEP